MNTAFTPKASIAETKLGHCRDASRSTPPTLPMCPEARSILNQPIYPVGSPSKPIENPRFYWGNSVGNIVNHGDFRID
jgi:hypothetical protein